MWNSTWWAFGVGYGYAWGQEPIVETNSEEFEALMDVLNSYSEMELRTYNLLGSFKLFYFMIPAVINLEARFPAGGRNYLRFQDDYKVEAQAFFPF